MSVARWQAVGATVARFHRAGVMHADLNAQNILLDDQFGVFLVDFDKSRKMPADQSWQKANLERLNRSLLKLVNGAAGPPPDLHFEQLLAGYRTMSGTAYQP
jgi:3-deoxy-D-manno-octulosonic acid kinase